MKRLVIFDLDGTLVDSMSIYARKASELLNAYYGVPLKKGVELYFKTSGLPFREQLEILFPGDKKNENVSREFEEWKKEVIPSLEVRPEGEFVIRYLKDRGILTAVSSNNLQKYVEEIFRKSEAPDFILGWDGMHFTKGEPHVAYLEKTTGLFRKDFLFVGDSVNDLKLMKSCGVPFVGLTSEVSEEEFKRVDEGVLTINRLSELLELILRNSPTSLK